MISEKMFDTFGTEIATEYTWRCHACILNKERLVFSRNCQYNETWPILLWLTMWQVVKSFAVTKSLSAKSSAVPDVCVNASSRQLRKEHGGRYFLCELLLQYALWPQNKTALIYSLPHTHAHKILNKRSTRAKLLQLLETRKKTYQLSMAVKVTKIYLFLFFLRDLVMTETAWWQNDSSSTCEIRGTALAVHKRFKIGLQCLVWI